MVMSEKNWVFFACHGPNSYRKFGTLTIWIYDHISFRPRSSTTCLDIGYAGALRLREHPGGNGSGAGAAGAGLPLSRHRRRWARQGALRCRLLRFSWSACDSQWTLLGLGARAVSMEGRAGHLRRRACPGAAGIGPTICNTEELQHKYYYDQEASPSGFAGAQTLMVGMRWPVDFAWTRGQSRLNGREGGPLETAGVPGSSRHWPDHLQHRRAATQILL